jgi:hypothetical protein
MESHAQQMTFHFVSFGGEKEEKKIFASATQRRTGSKRLCALL